MPLETANYIADLVATNPVHTDGLGQTDSHLRLLKTVLQNTFPNLGDAAVTSTAASLNVVTQLAGAGGAIIQMYTGSVASIPAGYHLCDGSVQTINGVSVTLPDLRNMFVLGAGSTYTPGTTGGGGQGTLAGSTDGFALTNNELPVHAHGVTDPTHDHFSIAQNLGGTNASVITAGGSSTYTGGASTGFIPTAIVNAYNNLATSNAATGITIQTAGLGNAHAHTLTAARVNQALPAYYALCFITRIA